MQSITITVSAATLNAIGAGLNELPHRIARPAIVEVENQVNKFLMEQKESESRSANSSVGGADEESTGPRGEDKAP